MALAPTTILKKNPWAKYQDFGHTYYKNSLFWGIGLTEVTVTGGGEIHGDALSTGTTAPGDGNKMFAIRSSSFITIHNMTLVHGGWFTIIIGDLDYFTMTDTSIIATRDGIDICQCRHVRIHNSSIQGGGDDALVLKSDYSTGPPKDSFDHVYSNLLISSPGASALRFGSETVGPIRDILWENITIEGGS